MRKSTRWRLRLAALAAAVIYAGPTLAAGCMQADEAVAIPLRHLQSRLMVAALSCNQRDAYNTFVLHFQPQLAEGGRRLIAYFQRAGGGSSAMNAYVTEIANAAGLGRAANPQGYCSKTWELFWALEQAPERLLALAAENMMETAHLPETCVAETPIAASMETAAPLVAERR